MSRLRAIAAHVRPGDALLAAALAIPSLVQVLVAPIAPRAVGVLIALLATVPIAFRGRNAALAAFIGSATWWIDTDGYIVLGYVAAALLFYSLGAHEPDSRRVLAVAGFEIAAGLVGTLRSQPAAYEFVAAVSIVIGPTLVGRIVRRQHQQAERLRELTWHLERERERSAYAAVTEERARIARELHDVVAHGVSVIAIQADAAEMALDRDPALARRPLATIHASAAEALADMRRLLGVLRDDHDGNDLTPQPGLAQLGPLLERAREAGLPVTLEQEGEPRELPASLDLAAYRILQEALTNVRKHASGAPAAVRLVWGAEALDLIVRDQGTRKNGNGTSGHGLLGMR